MSTPPAVFGKAITPRIELSPHIIAIKRSKPVQGNQLREQNRERDRADLLQCLHEEAPPILELPKAPEIQLSQEVLTLLPVSLHRTSTVTESPTSRIFSKM